MVQRLCIIEGCTDPKIKWGMCEFHFRLWKTLVHNEKMTKLFGWTDRDRFVYYLIKSPSQEIQEAFGAKPDCWVWKGALSENGYGIFSANTEAGKRSMHIHLFALSELAGVELFQGEETDHLCRFRPCANPKHLERVTHRENTLRGIGPSAVNARKQYCDKNHEFTRENTRYDENGGRACITCQKAFTSSEAYKEKRRDAYTPTTGVRGKGQYMAERDRCGEGHFLEGDNLIIEKKKRNGVESEVRRCRTCRNDAARRNHAARQGAEIAPGVSKSDCVTKKEAEEMMGIAPTYFNTFTKRSGNFPEPVRRGKPSYYLKADVVGWIQQNTELLTRPN